MGIGRLGVQRSGVPQARMLTVHAAADELPTTDPEPRPVVHSVEPFLSLPGGSACPDRTGRSRDASLERLLGWPNVSAGEIHAPSTARDASAPAHIARAVTRTLGQHRIVRPSETPAQQRRWSPEHRAP